MKLLKYLIFCLGLSHVSFDLAMDTSGKKQTTPTDSGEKSDKMDVSQIISVVISGASITALSVGLVVKLIKFVANKLKSKKQQELSKTTSADRIAQLKKDIEALDKIVDRASKVENVVKIVENLVSIVGLSELLSSGEASVSLIEGLILNLSKSMPEGKARISSTETQELLKNALERLDSPQGDIVSFELAQFLSNAGQGQVEVSVSLLKEFSKEFTKLIQAPESNPESFKALFQKYKQMLTQDTKVEYASRTGLVLTEPLNQVEDLRKFTSQGSRNILHKYLASNLLEHIKTTYPSYSTLPKVQNLVDDLSEYVAENPFVNKDLIEFIIDSYSRKITLNLSSLIREFTPKMALDLQIHVYDFFKTHILFNVNGVRSLKISLGDNGEVYELIMNDNATVRFSPDPVSLDPVPADKDFPVERLGEISGERIIDYSYEI